MHKLCSKKRRDSKRNDVLLAVSIGAELEGAMY